MTKYKWRSGQRYAASADVAHKEMERIRKQHGALTAPFLLDEAREKDNPLHEEFTWDNRKAAEQFRLGEARTLIRAIITVESADAPECNSYTLVSGDAAETTDYKPSEVVVQSPDMFADAIGRLSGELESARKSVRDLEQLAHATGRDPERMARIGLVTTALEAATAAVAQLH